MKEEAVYVRSRIFLDAILSEEETIYPTKEFVDDETLNDEIKSEILILTGRFEVIFDLIVVDENQSLQLFESRNKIDFDDNSLYIFIVLERCESGIVKLTVKSSTVSMKYVLDPNSTAELIKWGRDFLNKKNS